MSPRGDRREAYERKVGRTTEARQPPPVEHAKQLDQPWLEISLGLRAPEHAEDVDQLVSTGHSSARPTLLVVDEVGYILFDPEAASLMFSLVSNRYERASMIVISNKPFSVWGEIFGDDMAATAMIDRLIHHYEILSLKGDSYRLRGKDLDARRLSAAHLTFATR